VIDAAEMVVSLGRQGFGPFVGVPCSILSSLFSALAVRGAVVTATEEGEAVGMAAGMGLAGGRPVVLMQNAGFLNALNPLLSLHKVFELPLLLLISHRGEPGTRDAPEHEHCGRLTLPLLELAGITHEVLKPDGGAALEALIGRAAASVEHDGVHAIVVPAGAIRGEVAPAPASAPAAPRPATAEIATRTSYALPPAATIQRRAILAAVFARFAEAVFVSSTGFLAREAVAAAARAQASVFPVIGSMGCAGPVGLGLALSAPRRKVVVLDGDGALLMKLGALATIACQAPANLIHVVFNDGIYASTGGQPNAAGLVCLPRIARAAGYATSLGVTDLAQLDDALAAAANAAGPHMISVATTSEPSTEAPRLGEPPAQLARRLRALHLSSRPSPP
jgi:phosphonopyruvate decarboxylase